MIEKVAVGTDGSETAEKAVDFAFDVAAARAPITSTVLG